MGSHDECLEGDQGPTCHQDEVDSGIAGPSCVRLVAANHIAVSTRNSAQRIGPNKLAIHTGNFVIIYDYSSQQMVYNMGRDGGGIGAIAVHPEQAYIAIAEQCKHRAPNVYIYQLVSDNLEDPHSVLASGTERGYSAAAFSRDGELLATVGSSPDFMLTIWNWREASVILRYKAFSQEVYNVRFSPFFDGTLITSGTGHICMWKMAKTFTGLKLKGLLGKFGHVELSDVCAFLEFPDGKILSSTETGQLLLWTGNMIKAVLMRKGRTTCHDGNVEVLQLHQSGSLVVSAGQDGFIRTWDASKIIDVEPEDGFDVEIDLITEVQIPGNVHVKQLVASGDHWVIVDEAGSIIHVDVPEISVAQMKFTRLLRFHAGGISSMLTDRTGHSTVSGDAAGSIWVYDLRSQACVASRTFPTAITCITAASIMMDTKESVYYVGYAGGFLRQLLRCTDGWRLMKCYRPHIQNVIAMAVSPDGGSLVTCGQDGSLFFFDVQDNCLQPHAYMTLSREPVALVWTSGGVVVGCLDGMLLCVQPPDSHDHNAATTYQYSAPVAEHKFKLPRSMWPPPPKKADSEEQAREDESKAGGDGQPDDDGGEADPDWVPGAELVGPFPVVALFVHPKDPARFLLAAAGAASKFLFDCSFGQEDAVAVTGMSAAVTCAQHSPAGTHFLMGSCDGSVKVATVDSFGLPNAESIVWESQVHRLDDRVTAVCMTFDSTQVMSTASDGSMFTHELVDTSLNPGQHQAGAGLERFCSLADAEMEEGVDILDSDAYTIEQAKQRQEADNIAAAAEAKKATVREAVAQLKKEFEEILAENAAKPEAERLPLEFFDIDPDLKPMIEKEIKEAEDAVHEEMAYELEKQTLLLAKLKARYLDPLEVERIELHAFGSKAMVTSFRTAKLEGWVVDELERIANEKAKADEKSQNELDSDDQGLIKAQTMGDITDEDHRQVKGAKGKLKSKHELRMVARARRKAEWDAFLKTKPDDDYVNPDDEQAIIHATKNMGDYKLKSEKDYVPDETKRMTPEKKKEQIAILLQGIHMLKMEFNEKFLALRDVKRSLCEELKLKLTKVADLNKKLRIQEELIIPEMVPGEEPERRDHVTDEEVAAYIAQQEALADSAAEQGNGMGGFGAGGGQGPSKPRDTQNGTPATKAHPTDKSESESVEDMLARIAASYPPTPREQAARIINERRWNVDRDLLLGSIKQMKGRFDDALDDMRMERIDLAMSLKAAEVQVIVLIQEHSLLVDFSDRDKQLAGKLSDKHAEQKEILDKMGSCQQQLKDFKAQLVNVAKRKTEIASHLQSLVNETHPQHAALMTIFNRKVKRVRKSTAEDDEDEDDDEDDDGDDDDDLSDEDAQQETCPAGCDQALYEEVCVMREQRLDQEDIVGDITKTCDTVKKEQEMLKQKLKRVEQSLAATENDIRDFQMEKQAKLNEIEVMVMLRAHQIEYLEDDRLPADMSNAVVFSNDELARLRRRIDELAVEKQQMRKTQRELKKQHMQLTRDKAAKERLLADLDARAHDVQMLKFGREIDLDLLDQMGPSPGADDLRAQLLSQQKRFVAELKEWDRKIAARTEELVALTEENTTHLNTVAELTSQQKMLEAGIRRTRKELDNDPIAAQTREAAERDHMVEVIQAQAKEIDYIKSQINVLKRKDTSLFQ